MNDVVELKQSTRPKTGMLPQTRRRLFVRGLGVGIILFAIYSIYSGWTESDAEFERILEEMEELDMEY